jgi:DNA-binding GntR family transcriptional regulator
MPAGSAGPEFEMDTIETVGTLAESRDIPDRGGRVSMIYRSILDAIVEHRLPPRTKLSEDEIGTAFGVSRTLVRSALQALAHQNMVVIEKNRGAFVAAPTVEEAREVFETRRTIEAAIARRAAERTTPADIDRLERHLADEAEALHRGERPRAIQLSGLFHLAVAEIARQRVMERFLRELVSRASLVIALYGRSGASACGNAEHQAILQALAGHDPDRASAAMLAHLTHIEQDLDLDPAETGPVDVAAVLRGRG